MPLTWPCNTKSQHTNQQRQREKICKINLPARVPGHRALVNIHLEIFYFMSFSSVYLSTKSYLFEWFILQALKKGTCFFCYCSSIFTKKNAPAQVPGQRRLAISRFRVPNLDGFVIAAAGNFLSIGAPRHRIDTVFARSQYTNQQK